MIAYFLILLLVALGIVGILVDRIAANMKRAWEAADAKLIEQNYEIACKETKQQFEQELEQQARTLGRELRSKYVALTIGGRGFDRERERERDQEFRRYQEQVGAIGGSAFYQVGLPVVERPPRRLQELAAVVGGAAFSQAGLSLGERPVFVVRTGIYFAYWRHQIDEQVRRMFALESDEHPKYYQFDFPQPWRVLRNPAHEMPAFPIEKYGQNHSFDKAFDDVTVDGVPLYRIVYKSYLAGGPPRGLLPDPSRMLGFPAVIGGAAPPLPPALLDRSVDPLPFVYVQVARPKAELDARLAEHDQKRQEEVDRLADDTQKAMTRLRTQLAVIGAIMLIAVPTGAWLLVGRGVAPIRHLSDAVSRVSEKDFRLPVEPADLSRELVPIHDRLTQTLDALRRAFEREKQAVADISHELKTPIAALLTSVGVSLRKPRTTEQYKATLEECQDIGRQLSRLVDRIMTLASLDAGNDRTVAERVDAAELAADCATVVRPLAEAHGLRFSAQIDRGAELVTDPDKLREVLNNLLGNAVEYNRPGGSVELRVAAANGHVAFEVRDTGIGMTPEVREKIFERFYRADPSRHATGVHAGLGLAIVKEYVERLGGTIAVESEPGAGSAFRVTIPSAHAGPNGSAARPGQPLHA